MNEEKYAYIKLVSGEEIFAQVEEFVDEDKCLVAFDPCFIKELPVKRGPFALYRVEPWLKLSDERMFAFDSSGITNNSSATRAVCLSNFNYMLIGRAGHRGQDSKFVTNHFFNRRQQLSASML